MNLTIIPYFLAIIFVNESPWPLGPDYIFEVKKTTTVYRKPFITVEFNCQLQCQPRKDSLICFMPNVSFQTTITYENSTEYISPIELINIPHLFEIKFNKYGGVQSLFMKPSNYLNAVGIIRQIAELFNMSIDIYSRRAGYEGSQLQDNDLYLIDDFSAWEQTLRGNCNTYNRIMHDVNYKELTDIAKSKFYLTVLPLADYLDNWNINAPIFIEKTRLQEDCFYSERYIEFLNDMEMTNYSSGMKITNKQFESFVEVVASLTSNLWKERRVFSERINLSLIKVKGALKTLSNVSEGEWITLDKPL